MFFKCKNCGSLTHIKKTDNLESIEEEFKLCFNCYKEKNIINLWLDDLRPAPKGFVWVKNVFDCITVINKNKVKILSLDHDLGDEASGYDFVKWLVEKGFGNPEIYPQQIYLHTANPVGRRNMYQLLERYKPDFIKLYNGPITNYLNPEIDY